jgi:hypothetical protein
MKVLASFLISFTCCTALAQPSEIVNLNGYVDFGELSSVYGEPKVKINIGEKLLQFVSKMDRERDQDTAELFEKLKAVRVEVYQVNNNSGPAVAVLEKVAAQLQSRDWEPVVMVTDEGSNVRIFVKLNGDVIDGLVVMAVDKGGDAVFINIIGEIDPAQVGKVTRALNVDVDI